MKGNSIKPIFISNLTPFFTQSHNKKEDFQKSCLKTTKVREENIAKKFFAQKNLKFIFDIS